MSDVSAAPKPLTIDETEYLVHPFTDKDIIALEHWARTTLVERSWNAIPESLRYADRTKMRTEIVLQVGALTLMDSKISQLLASQDGLAHMCWLSLRIAKTEEPTEQTVRGWFNVAINVERWMETYSELNPNSFLSIRRNKGQPEPDKTTENSAS